MANVTIVAGCVQGLPTIISLVGSTVVSHASSITRTQVGSGYFYKGDTPDETLIGDAGTVATLKANGYIK